MLEVRVRVVRVFESRARRVCAVEVFPSVWSLEVGHNAHTI